MGRRHLSKMSMRRCIMFLQVLCLLLFAVPRGAVAASPETAFRHWLENVFWPAAHAHGIPRSTFDAAFRNVQPDLRLPDLGPPGLPSVPRKQEQREFGAPARYFSERSLRTLAAQGRVLLKRHDDLLRRIEMTWGVPARIVLAIWARESNYGHARIPHNVFRILGTQAWTGRRKARFRRELLAALLIARDGHLPVSALKSSWAGALGQPQMMPSTYLKWAVDFDGDGKRDIWRSIPDVLASIASHLAGHGWQRNRDWGFEVDVPASVPCFLEGPDRGRRLEEWLAMGIRRIGRRPFPTSERNRRLFLLMPAGRYGPAFLVTRNFYVLKEYNMSDLYALFVGHLGDRIRFGALPFSRPWRQIGHMLRSDIARMQRALERLGHDVGGADGLPGFRTRRSLGLWQKRQGLRPTCFPTPRLLRRFRRS